MKGSDLVDKNTLIEKILRDTKTDELLFEELRMQLDEELAKPYDSRDTDKIAQITEELAVLRDYNDSIDARIGAAQERLVQKLDSPAPKPKFLLRKRALAAVMSCMVLLIGLNIYSFTAFGQNIFSAIVEHVSNGFKISFSDDNPTNVSPTDQQPTEEDNVDVPPCGSITRPASDAVGFIEDVLAENGVTSPIPKYFPDDLSITDYEINKVSSGTSLRFFLDSPVSSLCMTVECYLRSSDIPEILYPNIGGKLEQIELGGRSVFLITNGDVYTAAFCIGKNVFSLRSEHLDYDTFINIVEEIK